MWGRLVMEKAGNGICPFLIHFWGGVDVETFSLAAVSNRKNGCRGKSVPVLAPILPESFSDSPWRIGVLINGCRDRAEITGSLLGDNTIISSYTLVEIALLQSTPEWPNM